MKVELVYLKQFNVIWLNRGYIYIYEQSTAGSFITRRRRGVRMQLKCTVRKRLLDESGTRERYERYVAKAVTDGTINYTHDFIRCDTLGWCTSRT